MSSPITPQQCDDIETRARAATPGPWQANHPAGFITAHGQTIAVFGGSAQDQADADFIAHAPEDVDALLATVRHLTARVTELERPTVEAKRNEIRESYTGLAAQAREDRDYEGAFDVECRLRKREEQWAAEDAAAAPASV